MNKTKRTIIQCHVKLIRKLVSRIQPFNSEMKWVNKWYVDNSMTPLQMASEVKVMCDSKLHSIFHLITSTPQNKNYVLYGNLFEVKFPICGYVSGIKNISELSWIYKDWCYKNNPEHKKQFN